jgi:hypothetical protein
MPTPLPLASAKVYDVAWAILRRLFVHLIEDLKDFSFDLCVGLVRIGHRCLLLESTGGS